MLEYTADTVQTAKWIHFLSKPPRREGKLKREELKKARSRQHIKVVKEML